MAERSQTHATALGRQGLALGDNAGHSGKWIHTPKLPGTQAPPANGAVLIVSDSPRGTALPVTRSNHRALENVSALPSPHRGCLD